MKTSNVILSAVIWSVVFGALLSAAGCVSYSKVEITRADGEKCRAVAEGKYFSFNTPGALDKCDPREER